MDKRREDIAAIARHQYGLITRAQALTCRVSARGVGRRLARGEWVAIDYGVYRIAGIPVTWHQRVLAACLAGPAVASHRSAARLWGFPVAGAGEIVEVTALRHKRRHRGAVRWHESQRLEERYVATVDAIPVTTPIRTVIDLGVVLDLDALEESLYGAMRRRLASVAGIERALEDLGSLRRGRKQVREVLQRAQAHDRVPETVLETQFLQILRSARVPLPIAQYEVRAHDGRIIGRADFAYPECRLLIELDGSQWHSIGVDVASDRERELALREHAYRMLRFGWRDVNHRAGSIIETVTGELSR